MAVAHATGTCCGVRWRGAAAQPVVYVQSSTRSRRGAVRIYIYTWSRVATYKAPYVHEVKNGPTYTTVAVRSKTRTKHTLLRATLRRVQLPELQRAQGGAASTRRRGRGPHSTPTWPHHKLGAGRCSLRNFNSSALNSGAATAEPWSWPSMYTTCPFGM